MSIPSTLIAGFIGLASCGDMVASDSEIIVAHRSRSAQGRVHFITTSRGRKRTIYFGETPYRVSRAPPTHVLEADGVRMAALSKATGCPLATRERSRCRVPPRSLGTPIHIEPP